MSADSPRRGVHKGAQVISPQPIVDRSIIDSVAGIINDIVPQAYVGTPNSDNRETISWARFEYADVNDPALYSDYNEGSSTPPLLLVLGYSTGVQVWLIAATGEATEVLSWRQGVVRTLRILPNPKTDDEHADIFEAKRPMVAICDSAGPGPQFCNISFISLRTGDQAKSIKFKNPVCDVLANRRSIVVTFLEKIAVFDARTLEDILTVTTCYASPGPNPNPVALGTRWLAYSEKKLLPVKRSSGGCEGDGVQSYTATVLYAAKSLGKGLRGLGETVASSLTGNSVSPVVINNAGGDVTQPGVITILDLQAAKEEKNLDDANIETVIAHFTAHSDAIVAMTFDLSGALLMTADKRGHDFHVFRIQPHPGGPTLAAVHHLYILHRGDTTAKVQDMVFSSDTRWAAVSTVRGTTHVFPVAPYGGPVGVRTHSTPHVVNRLSRFHRSAGLTDDGARSHSPVSHSEIPLSVYPYSNPRLPPYPHPTILHPLAQIRQPSTLNHINNQAQQSRPQQRQRLHSDDSGTLPLKICACFAPPRAWMYAQREPTSKTIKRAVDSLFIMACHGNMIQYDLEPKPAAGVPKEKVCDDTMIELEVEAKGQWPLQRAPNSAEIVPSLSTTSPLLSLTNEPKDMHDIDLAEDRWLSQVEIVTHAGPHRRLWMGPQFVFKTYNATSGGPVNLVEAEAIEVGVTGGSRPARSNPVNMPHAASRSLVPVVIDGSGSSYEQSPRLVEAYSDSLDSENAGIGSGENQLREDLAEAMLETSIAPHRAPGRRLVFERVGQPVTKVVNPLGTVITVSADEDDVNSSQEFDSAEESHIPEPSRSVCAEEGPASLADLEPESQTLPDLTEVCVEMRSATEPAIDSVPDEDIREVKERKELCVEIAPIPQPGNAIDFERTEAFRDVPTNLSLCVEQGEIPISPMTQAKETAWCKDFVKKGENRTHEGNLSETQFVVNCDDDSVVLMESRVTQSRSKPQEALCEELPKKQPDRERTRKLGKSSSPGACSTGKTRSSHSKSQGKKYIVQEVEDSIIIGGINAGDGKTGCSKKKGCCTSEDTKSNVKASNASMSKLDQASKDSGPEKSKTKSKSFTLQSSTHKDSITETKNVEKNIDPIIEAKEVELVVDCSEKQAEELKSEELKSEELEAVLECLEKCKSPSLDIPLDDFSSMEYHMIETTCYSKDTTLSNQSDEDIEHIHTSEIAQLNQSYCIDPDKCGDTISNTGSSPSIRRKNSKNTISDDDLEYIHTSELNEVSELHESKDDSKHMEIEKVSNWDSIIKRSSKQAISSDDDLEHIQHSDVCAIVPETSSLKDAREKYSTKKQCESSPEHTSKPKSGKKAKNIVVIEDDTSAADVTVIVKPVDEWSKTKQAEKKQTEELEEKRNLVEAANNDSNLSPVRKAKSRKSLATSSTSKRLQAADIEIIDIDAMQKAEMEIAADCTTTSECKILAVPQEISSTRIKKSRKNKKPQTEASAQNVQIPEISSLGVDSLKSSEVQQTVELQSTSLESQAPSGISWSSIVKKKGSIPTESDTEKEDEVKKLDSEEKCEVTDLVKCSVPIGKSESKKKKVSERSGKNLEIEDSQAEFISSESSSLVQSSAVIEELHDAVTDLGSGIVSTSSEPPKALTKKKQSSSQRDSSKSTKCIEDVKESEQKLKEAKSCKKWEMLEKLETKESGQNVEYSMKKTFSKVSSEPEDSISKRESSTEPEDCIKELFVKVEVSQKDKEGKSSSEGKRISEGSAVFEELLVESENLEKPNEEISDDDKSKPDEIQVELSCLKEDSSEPEKRSDSEQEVLPERSSSSDELNVNVFTKNKEEEEECLGREIIERSSVIGSNPAVSSTAKKGNRLKKKKRR